MGRLPLAYLLVLVPCFSLSSNILTDANSILSNTLENADERGLQEELLSWALAGQASWHMQDKKLPATIKKRASHGKGPAPVTRVINQVKLSKLSERRRNKNRGSNKLGASQVDAEEEEQQFFTTSTEPALENVLTSSKGRKFSSSGGSSVPDPDHLAKNRIPNKPDRIKVGIFPTFLPTKETETSGATLPPFTPSHRRLQKLDYYFAYLGIFSEDCRKRFLCEVAGDQITFQPLSFVLSEETSFSGEYEHLTPSMMNTTDGARLLSYMEANLNGQDRNRGCDVFNYRCPTRAREMINYEALLVWREMVRWLSVHVIARNLP